MDVGSVEILQAPRLFGCVGVGSTMVFGLRGRSFKGFRKRDLQSLSLKVCSISTWLVFLFFGWGGGVVLSFQ